MAAPFGFRGGIQITDAESVDLCPWVEFYPGVINPDKADQLMAVASSVILAVHELGISELSADFARIKSGASRELIALKFGSDEINAWTQYTALRMIGVDVSPVLEFGERLDKMVDFKHNGEIVIYRESKNLDFHLDGGKRGQISARRCLLTLDGEKTNHFQHPVTKQTMSSFSGPGDALTISHQAIRHAVSRDEPTCSLYIQADN